MVVAAGRHKERQAYGRVIEAVGTASLDGEDQVGRSRFCYPLGQAIIKLAQIL